MTKPVVHRQAVKMGGASASEVAKPSEAKKKKADVPPSTEADTVALNAFGTNPAAAVAANVATNGVNSPAAPAAVAPTADTAVSLAAETRRTIEGLSNELTRLPDRGMREELGNMLNGYGAGPAGADELIARLNQAFDDIQTRASGLPADQARAFWAQLGIRAPEPPPAPGPSGGTGAADAPGTPAAAPRRRKSAAPPPPPRRAPMTNPLDPLNARGDNQLNRVAQFNPVGGGGDGSEQSPIDTLKSVLATRLVFAGRSDSAMAPIDWSNSTGYDLTGSLHGRAATDLYTQPPAGAQGAGQLAPRGPPIGDPKAPAGSVEWGLSKIPDPGPQLSGAELNELIAAGVTPRAVVDDLLAGRSRLAGLMTKDSMAELLRQVSPAELDRQSLEGLRALADRAPATDFAQRELPAATGRTIDELVRQIINADPLSPQENALLAKIKDPDQRAQQELQMLLQKQALLAQMLTQIAMMRFESLKAVAMNFRG